jgi:hypothetical protein
MPFRLVPPSDFSIIEEWRCGPVSVVALRYLLGQIRLQVWWRDSDLPYPDVIGPEV